MSVARRPSDSSLLRSRLLRNAAYNPEPHDAALSRCWRLKLYQPAPRRLVEQRLRWRVGARGVPASTIAVEFGRNLLGGEAPVALLQRLMRLGGRGEDETDQGGGEHAD